MDIEYIIRNGKLVIPKFGILEADLAIANEKIIQIGNDITTGAKVIDAKGRYVFPGCVDTHTHYGHFNEFYDEMETESKCLGFMGITTAVILLDRCIKNMEEWIEKRGDLDLFVNFPGISHALWKDSYHKVLPDAINKSSKRSMISSSRLSGRSRS